MPSISPPPLRPASGVERDRPDLGARGVVALLTPAENPTAEPELSLLMPPDVNLLTARMYAPASEMSARLKAYETRLEEWLAPFGDAPLDAVAFACTGSTYLLGPSRRRPEALERRHGPCPVVCAADALKDGLQSLRAQRITLVSPYPSALTEAAQDHWRAAGYDVAAVIQSPLAHGAAHPIYGQTAATLLTGLRQGLKAGVADAVIVMGTGAPSLAALAIASEETDIPILSSNLATAWSVAHQLGLEDRPLITEWLASDAPWRERLWSRFPAVRARLKSA
ncbi:maleate cis-trans isomerase family protein [Brevundimonas naejangsanensis]|uniref:maleate cis-trans isomerase family protein n=1 Tax=Brevundimonas naejangsanensis TaxID=588932 RepID=UPI003CFDD949